jgi:hypothetical protein
MQPCKRQVRPPTGSPPAQGRSLPEQAQSEKSQGVRGTESPDSFDNAPRNRELRVRFFGGSTVSRTGVNAGIAQLRSDCRLTMGEQLALQSKVLARVAADEPGLRTLFWGGLGKWPEWSGRLALAATRSESWDAKAGQPKVGESINAFALSLMTFHSGKEFSYGEKDRLVAGDLSDVKGVILFGMRHSDLWDGSKVRYNTDFTDGTKTVSEIHVWETPS